MGLTFYTTYSVGLVFLCAVLSCVFGLKIALLLLGAIPVSSLLLLVLCSVPAERERARQPSDVGL
jgi:hypothetical protein